MLLALFQAFLFWLGFLLDCLFIFIPRADIEARRKLMDQRSREVVGNALMLLHLEEFFYCSCIIPLGTCSPSLKSSSVVCSWQPCTWYLLNSRNQCCPHYCLPLLARWATLLADRWARDILVYLAPLLQLVGLHLANALSPITQP